MTSFRAGLGSAAEAHWTAKSAIKDAASGNLNLMA